MKKIHLSYFIGSMDIGGTEKHVLHLINSLSKEKFKIELHLLYREGNLVNEVSKRIKIFTPKFKFNSRLKHFVNFFSSYLRIKKSNPDIIHCFLPHAYLFGGLIGLIHKKKVIMSRRSLNTYQDNYKFLPIKKIEGFLHKRSKLILANSSAVGKQLVQEGVDRKKLKILYNGIIPHVRLKNQTIKKLRSRLNLSSNHFIFLVVANLIPYKNHHMILNAVEILKNKTKRQFKVIFIGSGNKKYEQSIKTSILEKDLVNIVIMVKKSKEIFNFFKIADVGISSSNEEGFSNSILEFMSFGIPIIATDVGGNPEIINDTNGFLVKKNHHYQLYEKMKIFMEKPKVLKKLSSKAKQDSRNYNFRKMIKEYTKIYTEVNDT